MTLMITSLSSLRVVIVNNAGNGSGSNSTIRIRNQYTTSDKYMYFRTLFKIVKHIVMILPLLGDSLIRRDYVKM
jgi:hypothetical protein